MRTLFIPLAKLLGIHAVFQPLFYIGYMAYMVCFRSSASQGSIRSVLVFSGIYSLGIVFALLLVFKTERIADMLRIPSDGPHPIPIEPGFILRIGFILIGVAAIVNGIPGIIGTAVQMAEYAGKMPAAFQDRFWRSICETVLGICLLLQAHRLTEFLCKPKST